MFGGDSERPKSINISIVSDRSLWELHWFGWGRNIALCAVCIKTRNSRKNGEFTDKHTNEPFVHKACAVIKLRSFVYLRLSLFACQTVCTVGSDSFRKLPPTEIQTHKRFKRTLLIRTKHNMRIFGVTPFFRIQDNS